MTVLTTTTQHSGIFRPGPRHFFDPFKGGEEPLYESLPIMSTPEKVTKNTWQLDDGTVVELMVEHFYFVGEYYEFPKRYTLVVNGTILVLRSVAHHLTRDDHWLFPKRIVLTTLEGQLTLDHTPVVDDERDAPELKYSADWCVRERVAVAA